MINQNEMYVIKYIKSLWEKKHWFLYALLLTLVIVSVRLILCENNQYRGEMEIERSATYPPYYLQKSILKKIFENQFVFNENNGKYYLVEEDNVIDKKVFELKLNHINNILEKNTNSLLNLNKFIIDSLLIQFPFKKIENDYFESVNYNYIHNKFQQYYIHMLDIERDICLMNNAIQVIDGRNYQFTYPYLSDSLFMLLMTNSYRDTSICVSNEAIKADLMYKKDQLNTRKMELSQKLNSVATLLNQPIDFQKMELEVNNLLYVFFKLKNEHITNQIQSCEDNTKPLHLKNDFFKIYKTNMSIMVFGLITFLFFTTIILFVLLWRCNFLDEY